MLRAPKSELTPRRRRHLAMLVLHMIAFGLLVAPESARADDLVVRYDQATLLRLPRAVAEVITGNPSVADVTIQGSNMLVITGKTFGITNVIALDAERNIIQDQRVIVERDNASIVNLYKSSQRLSFSCTPSCSSTFTIGDENSYFDTIARHSAVKTKFSNGSTEVGDGGQGGQ